MGLAHQRNDPVAAVDDGGRVGDRNAALYGARLGDDMNRLPALAELAHAMTLLGDATHAAGVYDRLAPYAQRNILNARGAAGYGSASLPPGLLAALLGRRDRARAHLTDAVARNTAMDATEWAERSRAALAALPARTSV